MKYIKSSFQLVQESVTRFLPFGFKDSIYNYFKRKGKKREFLFVRTDGFQFLYLFLWRLEK